MRGPGMRVSPPTLIFIFLTNRSKSVHRSIHPLTFDTMKLQQLPAVLACILLFLLIVSPEFTEALPFSGLPKGLLPKGGLPKGGLPEGGLPKGGLPEGGLPEGGLPKGGLPEGLLPKGGLPKGGLPEGLLPKGGSGSTTTVTNKKWLELLKKYEEVVKMLKKHKKEFKRLEEIKEKAEKIQDIVDFWNTYAPGQVSPACRDLAINSTKIGPSPKVVTFCNPRRCTESCNNDSYNCGVCFRAHLCLCYTN